MVTFANARILVLLWNKTSFIKYFYHEKDIRFQLFGSICVSDTFFYYHNGGGGKTDLIRLNKLSPESSEITTRVLISGCAGSNLIANSTLITPNYEYVRGDTTEKVKGFAVPANNGTITWEVLVPGDEVNSSYTLKFKDANDKVISHENGTNCIGVGSNTIRVLGVQKSLQ
ncbi:MAG: hypothetical protein IPN76_16925 [Saprospiraceae bacterium]|nr:hypothetical protein [Saprospiraceae bacterium]